MITRTFLLVLLTLIAALTASVADSAKDMLAGGRVDEAIIELNGRLSSAAADAESSNLLCRAYFALEDWDRAESSCRKAVSLDPDNSRFHLWLGRVCLPHVAARHHVKFPIFLAKPHGSSDSRAGFAKCCEGDIFLTSRSEEHTSELQS